MKNLTIATHSGPFHADEVFGVATVLLALANTHNITVVRSRDPEVYDKADLRIDVSGRYDPDQGDFDHHQVEFSMKRDNEVPYASFGIVWKHFGHQLCSDSIVEKMDAKLCQPIDAIDTGFTFYEELYHFKPYSISAIIKFCNPPWNAEERHDSRFMGAVELAKNIIKNQLSHYRAREAADDIVRHEIAKHPGRKYLLLENYVPSGILKDFEDVLFVVFPDSHGNWTIKSVPKEPSGFKSRKMLPEAWAGLRQDDLAKVTGVADVEFCHKGRWIASAKSKEGALKLLELALKD